MAGELRTSVEDTNSDGHLINLEEDFKGFLEEKGFHFVEDGTSKKEADDLPLAMNNPEHRKKKIVLKLTNNHLQAWQKDIMILYNDMKKPSSLKEAQPVYDFERSDFQDEGSIGTAVSHTMKRSSTKKKKEEQVVRYVVSLNEILLSDGSKWSFVLDDVLQIVRDVATSLAEEYHAKSIVYGDLQAGNIFINDFLRAFLIACEKSKKQSKETELVQECIGDVRRLCKVMGGLYQFYLRNKPRDAQNSNQKEETALFALLQKGYTNGRGITAKQFLDELGHIIVKEQVYEQDLPKKKVPESESSAVITVPELGSLPINQGLSGTSPGPEQGAGLTSNEIAGPGSEAYNTESSVDNSRDGAATHEKLMSDFKMEMFRSFSSEASLRTTDTEQT